MNRVKNFIRLAVEGSYSNLLRITLGADRLTNTKMRDKILEGQIPPLQNVDHESCISCGMCSRTCPTEAITMTPTEVDDEKTGEKKKRNFPVIDHLKCVYCFQCHDVCPVFTKMKKAAADIFDVSIRLGGTLSGEHGVGSLKLAFLEQDIGPISMDVMSGIKKALDPKNILNPGKVVPDSLPGGAELFSW